MAMSLTKGEGTTVLTMTSEPGSNCPLVFQLLGSLCCSPVCSVSQGLRRLLAGTQTTLGTVQIMVGLFNIGLGTVLLSTQSYFLESIRAPYWLGGLFIASGVMSILSDRFPSPCLVFLTACMNLANACLAVTAIVLYSVDLGIGHNLSRECGSYHPARERYRYWETTAYPDEGGIQEEYRKRNFELCQSTLNLVMVMLSVIDIVLIVFAVLQLCVTISATVLGVKAMWKNRREGKLKPDLELFMPLLEEVTTNPTA
ncbi:hypothetical protein AAFF_G00426590 [Aldrovandia affinis]|uniref:Uncharacterized protein n=1 Tax=Aldrovandia affinis TaxID=143900 RepID=A0AAD7S9E6_9TELE|nr:hypothetical protein AAFF_G00426590 [Aldrovandia affinis]